MRKTTSTFIAVVVIHTSFRVVGVWRRTRSDFKRAEIKVCDEILVVAGVKNAWIIDPIRRMVH